MTFKTKKIIAFFLLSLIHISCAKPLCPISSQNDLLIGIDIKNFRYDFSWN